MLSGGSARLQGAWLAARTGNTTGHNGAEIGSEFMHRRVPRGEVLVHGLVGPLCQLWLSIDDV